MSYDGGKAGAGVYQALINLMPAHDLYVEPFLGAGALLRKKLPAKKNIGVERDPDVLQMWRGDEIPNLTLIGGDAFEWLRAASPKTARGSRIAKNGDAGPSVFSEARTLIYCDPPYVTSTRSCSHRPLYRCQLSDRDHAELLGILKTMRCAVMISGYRCALYNRLLADWRMESFWTTNRAGRRVQEFVWMNFPPPRELHDYRFLGTNFRERERIKRQQKRWRNRLAKMPALERLALMNAIAEIHCHES